MLQGTVPVFLLTGFLGSGKTTLLNAVLRHAAFADTLVVVNEFGEIGLDHLLLAESTDSVVLLESGCLCCTISGSLHETLADLNGRKARGDLPPFRRVVVETTGLADPAPIVNTLLGNRLVTDHYRLEAVVVTVDAQHAPAQLDSQPEVARQVALADRIVVTKRDLVPEPLELLDRLARMNPTASLVDGRDPDAAREAFAPLAVPRIDERPRSRYRQAAGAFAHANDIRSSSYVLERPPTWAGIAAWWHAITGMFGDRMLRCKGIVQIAGSERVVLLQAVQRVFHPPRTLAGWPDADRRSRLVCITRDVDEAALQETLALLDVPEGTPPEHAGPRELLSRMA